MSDLIERLEGGQAVTDEEVLVALGWVRVSVEWEEGVDHHWRRPDGTETHTDLILPTTDMNAALALVPEGWLVDLTQTKDGWLGCVSNGRLYRPARQLTSTPCRALLAAIFRARGDR